MLKSYVITLLIDRQRGSLKEASAVSDGLHHKADEIH